LNLFFNKGENAEVVCGFDEESATMSHPHAVSRIPLFQYDPPKVGQRTFGTISVGHEIFHNILEMDDFYKALGYDNSARRKQISGEEFIWERYRRDGAKKNKHCLQVQIQVYLYKNASKFRQLYGDAYCSILGKCTSSIVDYNDKHCSNCPMIPNGAN